MNIDCNICGFLLSKYDKICPKCETAISSIIQKNEHYEIDISHNGQTWEQAREEFLKAIAFSQKHRYESIRIIHGYGSAGGNSVIKDYVLTMLKMYKEKYGWKYQQCPNNKGSHIMKFK